MPKQSRLNQAAVFLSASVPSKERSQKYQRIENAAVCIEEAVIAVARAVFSAGGNLVFGGHPSISPLVASVLREYQAPEVGPDAKVEHPEGQPQPKVTMYQSKVWEPFWAEESKRLAENQFVDFHWTPIVEGESISQGRTDGPKAPKSMTEMRKQMVESSSPVAMIIIGGMEGTEEEAILFAKYRHGQPIFVLTTTGGAASLIERRIELSNTRVIVSDKLDRDEVERFWKTQEDRDPRSSQGAATEGSAPTPLRERKYYVPYSFIAQHIVEVIARHNG
jgi:hypothetical protein